jgi:UDP-N-acetylmuramate dehydrogenase
VVETVRVARDGKVTAIPGSEVHWNYRHTSFREGELLLGATLRLQPDDPNQIAARMDQAKGQRMATQPHGARSAGCFFKNAPASPVGTGKMIDDLGMKGTKRGGAVVSPKHANFIVTEGEDAKAADASRWRKDT